MTHRVVINGRFLTQPVTGVQRYAREATRALDALLAEGDPATHGWAFELVVPGDSPVDFPLRRIALRRSRSRLRGHVWEQLVLPRQARRRLLVSLATTGPLAVRHRLVVIFDASVWAIPSTFSRAFRTWYRVLLPALARRSARVATISEFSRGELVRYARVPAEKLTLAVPGIDHIHALVPDHAGIARLALPARPFVLAVGSDVPHKQFAVIEAAMSRPECADIDLVFAGGPAGRSQAPPPSAPRGRARRVGRVSDCELRALYERALCVAFPSSYEGFGLPPLEAMASGCPVVVSRAGSLPEVCGDGALYCDVGDAAGLAAQIARLANDSQLRAEMIARGRRRAAQFTWRDTARALLAALGATSDAPAGGRPAAPAHAAGVA